VLSLTKNNVCPPKQSDGHSSNTDSLTAGGLTSTVCQIFLNDVLLDNGLDSLDADGHLMGHVFDHFLDHWDGNGTVDVDVAHHLSDHWHLLYDLIGLRDGNLDDLLDGNGNLDLAHHLIGHFDLLDHLVGLRDRHFDDPLNGHRNLHLTDHFDGHFDHFLNIVWLRDRDFDNALNDILDGHLLDHHALDGVWLRIGDLNLVGLGKWHFHLIRHFNYALNNFLDGVGLRNGNLNLVVLDDYLLDGVWLRDGHLNGIGLCNGHFDMSYDIADNILDNGNGIWGGNVTDNGLVDGVWLGHMLDHRDSVWLVDGHLHGIGLGNSLDDRHGNGMCDVLDIGHRVWLGNRYGHINVTDRVAVCVGHGQRRSITAISAITLNTVGTEAADITATVGETIQMTVRWLRLWRRLGYGSDG